MFPAQIEANLVRIDGMSAPDICAFRALRQRLPGAIRVHATGIDRVSRCPRDRTLDTRNRHPRSSVQGARRRRSSPNQAAAPSCQLFVHEEVCLLSLCCATQSGSNAGTRPQAGALVGPMLSSVPSASLERLTGVFARRSFQFVSTAAVLRRAFH